MPYSIRKSGQGYKVTNKKTGKTYSKKPMSKEKAKKQIAALHINTNESFEQTVIKLIEKLKHS
jgi:hypothetical protein